MNKNYLILGLCGFLAFAACQDELEPQPEQPGKDTPTEVITTGTFTGISYEDETAAAADTKVDYSAKDKVFAATWTKEDCIYVTSAADGDEITLKPYILTGEGGTAVGTFEGEEISGTTFSAVYSRTGAAVTEDKKQIAVEFPSTQTYIANGIESHIVPMYAVSNSSSLKFKYGSGIIRLNLWNAEPVTVTKIEIVTDVPAAGTMLVHPADEKFPCGYSVGGGSLTNMNGVEVKGASEYVITYNIEGGVVLGQTAETATKFNIAVAASNHIEGGKYGSFKARIYSSDGQVKKIAPSGGYAVKNGTVHNIVKNAAGDPFEFDNISIEQTEAPVVELQGATSSTLSFKWTVNDKVDRDRPYTVALYKDEACSELLASWKIVANDGAYKTGDNYWHHTAFNFSGLAANTPYWCKVTDTENNLVSNAVAGTTADFTPVPVGAEVGEGETVLAEDFSELIWGGDMVYNSIGYIFNTKGENDTTLPFPDTFTKSEGDTHDGYIKAGCTTEKSLFGDYRTAAGSTRLAAWAHITNNTSAGVHIYARPGHLKLSKSSVWTRLATPVLSNLRETATLTVKFKASPYYDHDQQSIADAFSACVSVLTNTGDRADNGTIAEYDELVAKEFTLVDAKNVWTEYEFDIPNVPKGARIAIGTNDKADGKHRMFIDDIEITVKAYETVKMPVVRLQGATSSTLSFQWSENGFTDAEEDAAPNYEVGLYTDEACTSDNLVVSWEISANNELYTAKDGLYRYQPAFNFGGLKSGKTYYCKVTDTDTGMESSPVSGTTKEFTVVTVGDDKVAVGGIVLAEDFSELVWAGDWVFPGLSSTIRTKTALVAASGKNPTGSYKLVNSTTDDRLFHGYGGNPNTLGELLKKTRLVEWGTITTNTSQPSVYARLGYLRLGTTSNLARIVTPVLSNLQGTATVKVSFKASPFYDYDQQDKLETDRSACITVLTGTSRTSTDSESYGAIVAKDEYVAHEFELEDAKNQWKEYSYEVRNVTPESRISIGMVNKSYNRMFVDDVKIEVVAYEADTAPVVELQGATTSTLSFKWTMNGDYDRDRPYKVALYDNSECGADNLVVSWNIPANASQYTTGLGLYNHPTAFNFSGLTSNTPYWCKVTDLSNGAVSAVATGTTEAFTIVKIDENAPIVAAGEIALAEDFSELVWDGDVVYNGLSYRAKKTYPNTFTIAKGENPSGYELVACTSDIGAGLFTTNYNAQVLATRLATWGWLNKDIYGRCGFLRIGIAGTAGKVVTPELTNLDRTATLKVSVKIAPFYDHDQETLNNGNSGAETNKKACISVLEGASYSNGKVTLGEGATETVMETFDIDQTKNKWTTYERTIPNVPKGARIAIGSVAAKNNRMYIDEIVITVVSYNE